MRRGSRVAGFDGPGELQAELLYGMKAIGKLEGALSGEDRGKTSTAGGGKLTGERQRR